MSYLKDRNASDNMWQVVSLNLFTVGWGEPNPSIRKATEKEDIDHSVDGYYNDVPVQYRFQDHNQYYDMVGTVRHKRKNTRRSDQVQSELYKIFKNKREGKLYPHKLIWATADSIHSPIITSDNIRSIMIYDIDDIIDKCHNGLYYIDEELTPKDNLQDDKPNGKGSFEMAEIKDNYDGSSSFVVLWGIEPEFNYRRDSQ